MPALWCGRARVTWILILREFTIWPGGWWTFRTIRAFITLLRSSTTRARVRKSAGTGTTTIAVVCNNSGVVEAQTGTLRFQGGGTLGGSFAASAGAAVNFAGGTFALGGAGVVSSGAGQVVFTGGDIAFSEPISNFTMTGGTLVGTNVVTGTLNCAGGSVLGALTDPRPTGY